MTTGMEYDTYILRRRQTEALEKIALELRRIRSLKQIELQGKDSVWYSERDLDSGSYH